MTKEAFSYALQHVQPQAAKTLWLYGDTQIVNGSAYTPYYGMAMAYQERNISTINDISEVQGEYDAVFIDCPKNVEETEGLIALALQKSRAFVMAVAANDAGGKRLLKLFKQFGVEAMQLSKHHCKVVWTMQASQADKKALAQNLLKLEPQLLDMANKQWWTCAGIFGWNKIDVGSQMLAEHLPTSLSGVAADFGCGFGYLSHELLQRCKNITQLDAYDNDMRAIIATKKNVETANALWMDIRHYEATPKYDIILMNPPFHEGKNTDIALGEMFIRKAYASLRSNGRLFIVANAHLPYERTVPTLATIAQKSGYKIMTANKL